MRANQLIYNVNLHSFGVIASASSGSIDVNVSGANAEAYLLMFRFEFTANGSVDFTVIRQNPASSVPAFEFVTGGSGDIVYRVLQVGPDVEGINLAITDCDITYFQIAVGAVAPQSGFEDATKYLLAGDTLVTIDTP